MSAKDPPKSSLQCQRPTSTISAVVAQSSVAAWVTMPRQVVTMVEKVFSSWVTLACGGEGGEGRDMEMG